MVTRIQWPSIPQVTFIKWVQIYLLCINKCQLRTTERRLEEEITAGVIISQCVICGIELSVQELYASYSTFAAFLI